jgi:uncharacterized membrane protein required for colicin V production
MPLETILFLVALLPILWRAWCGYRMGATVEFRYAIVCFFALLVALRYWYPLTSLVHGFIQIDVQYLTAGVCIVLFLLGAAVASLIIDIKAQIYLSVRQNPLDTVLGVIAGMISGAAIGCSILLAASVALPGKVDSFATANYPLPLHEYPAAIFRTVEQNIAHIAFESTSHTPIPTVKISEEPDKLSVLDWQ